MTKPIEAANPFQPFNHDEAERMTPEQLVKARGAKTPEEKVKALARRQTNEVAAREFQARGEDGPKSAVGRSLSAGLDRATAELPVGGFVELGAEAKVGEGVEANVRGKIEVARSEHGWEVSRTIGGGAGVGAHAGGIFEAGAAIAGDFSEHYEYRSRESAISAAAAMGQQPLPEGVVDPDLDLRLNRLQFARTATSFSMNTELLAKAGFAAGPIGADAEGKLGSAARVKVDERTGDVALELPAEASQRFGARAGLDVGAVGASIGRDAQTASTSIKTELDYKLTASELALWMQTRDPRVLVPAMARIPVAAKVTESAELNVAGERFRGQRVTFVDVSSAKPTAGKTSDFTWSRGASTTTVAIGGDLAVLGVKLDAKVAHPGVKMVGVSTQALKATGADDANLAAHRARANVHP